MKNNLLAACADGSLSASAGTDQSIAAATREALQECGVAGTDKVTTPCLGVVAVEPDAGTPAPLLPSAPGRAPNSPRAPPWGVMQPAVQRLTPIGLSPIEAAQFLGTSRSRIYRLLREGRLVALKQGVATIVTMESLTAYVGSLPAATFRRPAIAA
jgi:excisionase family DNA binding protein